MIKKCGGIIMRKIETTEQALEFFKLKGNKSLRQLARDLNANSTTIQNRAKEAEKILKDGQDILPEEKPQRIIFADFEVSKIKLEIETYGLKNYNSYYRHEDVTRDYSLLAFGWMSINDKEARCISVSSKAPFNDEFIVRKAHEIISNADVVIGHNWDQFDIKKLNTRCLFYGLPPIKPTHTIDTLKEARKNFALTSKSLAYLAKYLKLENEKMESPDWYKIQNGNYDEIQYMREYCKRDVELLIPVYKALRPWMKNHPNMLPYIGEKDVVGHDVDACTTCGSTDLKVMDSINYTRAGNAPKMILQCQSCHAINLRKIKKGGQ